jgi:hypothetical protein
MISYIGQPATLKNKGKWIIGSVFLFDGRLLLFGGEIGQDLGHFGQTRKDAAVGSQHLLVFWAVGYLQNAVDGFVLPHHFHVVGSDLRLYSRWQGSSQLTNDIFLAALLKHFHVDLALVDVPPPHLAALSHLTFLDRLEDGSEVPIGLVEEVQTLECSVHRQTNQKRVWKAD